MMARGKPKTNGLCLMHLEQLRMSWAVMVWRCLQKSPTGQIFIRYSGLTAGEMGVFEGHGSQAGFVCLSTVYIPLLNSKVLKAVYKGNEKN